MVLYHYPAFMGHDRDTMQTSFSLKGRLGLTDATWWKQGGCLYSRSGSPGCRSIGKHSGS